MRLLWPYFDKNEDEKHDDTNSVDRYNNVHSATLCRRLSVQARSRSQILIVQGLETREAMRKRKTVTSQVLTIDWCP